ncbi:hypothetical protein CDAR_416441 [Caerostris darwini]|uniref:Uncharacterized protein n=1 Tax=Caerostris darwini TaxID=1538125 RepID=A0AAV4U1D4_9ARAC|nr:hypothetical protein CDAR_416441 [Caerostris darwini]
MSLGDMYAERPPLGPRPTHPNDESSANSSRRRHNDMKDARNFAIERAAGCNRGLGPCHCRPQRHPEGSGEKIY